MNFTLEAQLSHTQYHLSLLLKYLKLHDYLFTTISPASHQKVNNRTENKLSKNLVGVFGWNRPFVRESISADLFDLMQAANIITKVEGGWKSQLRVSSIAGQLILHSAYPTLGNESVFFGPDSYRFANAIHQYFAINRRSIFRAVDIGTGSGVGAILLALALQKSELKTESETEIVGIDINQAALDIAQVNITAAGVHGITLLHSNLLKNVTGNFDLIIANPPYLLDDTERVYRHGGGLLGAELSLDIVDSAIARLNAGGTLLLYTGVTIVDGQDAFITEAATKLSFAGFTYEYYEIDPDIFGEELLNRAYSMADRIAAVVLTAKKPGGFNTV